MNPTLLILLLIYNLVSAAEPINIESKRELFIDDFLIESLDDAEIRLSIPKDEGLVHRFDKSWEGPFCGYSTVINDDGRYLIYYRGLPKSGKDGSEDETTCIITSNDGINWTRPELSYFLQKKYPRNNIVLANAAPVTHNFSPFLDTNPNRKPNQKFKALGGTEKSGLIAYISEDGLRWNKLDEKAVFKDGIFDSQNVSFWSEHEKCYVCYFRTWTCLLYTSDAADE